MAGPTEGGKKAAEHQDMNEKGRKGAEELNSDVQKKSEASRKAAETRGSDNMAEMDRKDGEHSHGDTRKSGEK